MDRMTAAQLVEMQARTGGLSRMRARGRLPAGEMNKTEARYAGHLDQLKLAGEILWWRFEAIKLRLAPDTHLTVDFAVMRKDGLLLMEDVKGAAAIYQDDAKVKMKLAAAAFPFIFRVVIPRKGGWDVEEIGPARGAGAA